MPDLVTITPSDAGAFWRVTFGGAKGNILDRALLAALSRMFQDAAGSAPLKAICLEGAGGHFSFGASVQEHLPDQAATMLVEIRQLITDLLDSEVIVLAAVRGRCLGGGLELASVCHRIFASADAQLGQPEIVLGVFPPIASVVLPGRIGRANAEDLCLTGRMVPAAEALRMGLVDEVPDGDPADAALAWARTHLAPKSAKSLRLAVKAVRARFADQVRTELPRLEEIYLNELMATTDAVEGLQAFLEKRPPAWRDA